MAGISILPYETIPAGKHNIANKQDKLVSGENIKTINNQSILGEGNLNIQSSEAPDLNSPIDFGDAEHSAVLKGETSVAGVTYKNEALNEGCVSLGANSKAGLKGYYFTFIDFDTNQIWLHNKQFTSRLLGKYGGWTSNGVSDLNRCGWAKDDVISFTCNGHYDNSAKIVDVRDNVITVDKLPFTLNDVPKTITSSLGELIGVNINNKFDECSVFCVKKFNIGTVELGGNAFAIGTNTQASNAVAYAEGYNTVAYGKYSHAEGNETEAGYNAHAEGYLTKAIGDRSHAEGRETQSIGDRSHAEGRETTATGNQSHAEGYKTKANGGASHAEGSSTEAGENAHSEGLRTKATGGNSHAEGESTEATNYNAHAEGKLTVASGDTAHAEGLSTVASGKASHVEGAGLDYNDVQYGIALGENSHAEGQSRAEAKSSHSEGDATIARGKYSHSEGCETLAEGESSHSEGYLSQAKGSSSHTEGANTIAIGDNSHAEGQETQAIGTNSHSEGYKSKANGASAHAEGEDNSTEGVCSHIEGYSNRIYKDTTDSSHAEGEYNVVNPGAYASHVEGEYNQVNNRAEHASGQYNKSTKSDVKSEATHFSIGIGTSVNDRKNALEVKQDGKVYIKGIGNYGVATSNVVDLATIIISLQQEIEQLKTQLKTE